jgi:nucleoside-diphosphate-sugar epimerase
MKSNHEGPLVLVTGGAGYIGCRLVPALLDAGYRVRVFDVMFYGDAGLTKVRDHIEVIEGDIRSFPPELLDWLRWASESGNTPVFVRRVAEAALIACIPDYLLLRPVLAELKRRYPEDAA